MRVLAWPRSPRKTTSCPASSGVLELRADRVLVAQHPLEERLARRDAGDGVATDLLLDRDGLPAGGLQLTERGRSGVRRRHGRDAIGHPACSGGATRSGRRRRRLRVAGMELDRSLAGGRRRRRRRRDDDASGPTIDEHHWEPCRCRATGASSPPSPTATARCSTAAASTTPRPPTTSACVRPLRWRLLPGRRVARRRLPGRPRGLLLPPHLRHHRSAARAATSTSWASRCRAPATGRPPSATSPACSRTELGDPDGGTPAASGARSTSSAPAGSHRPLRVLCRDANDTRAHLRSAPCSTARRPEVRVRTIVDGAVLAEPRPLARRRQRGRVDHLDVDDPGCGGRGPGRAAALRRAVEVTVDGAEPSHRWSGAPGFREVAPQGLDPLTSTASACSPRAPTSPPPASRSPGHRPSLCAATSRSPGTPASTWCGCTATSPAPSCTTRPTSSGMLVWQDFPLQWSYARTIRKQAVRQAREAVDLLGHHPSVAVWCAHDAARVDGRCCASRPDVEQDDPRPLGEARPRAGRRVAPALTNSGVPPHVSQLDGSDSHLTFGWGPR
jgi:hypothetical protein